MEGNVASRLERFSGSRLLLVEGKALRFLTERGEKELPREVADEVMDVYRRVLATRCVLAVEENGEPANRQFYLGRTECPTRWRPSGWRPRSIRAGTGRSWRRRANPGARRWGIRCAGA